MAQHSTAVKQALCANPQDPGGATIPGRVQKLVDAAREHMV